MTAATTTPGSRSSSTRAERRAWLIQWAAKRDLAKDFASVRPALAAIRAEFNGTGMNRSEISRLLPEIAGIVEKSPSADAAWAALREKYGPEFGRESKDEMETLAEAAMGAPRGIESRYSLPAIVRALREMGIRQIDIHGDGSFIATGLEA